MVKAIDKDKVFEWVKKEIRMNEGGENVKLDSTEDIETEIKTQIDKFLNALEHDGIFTSDLTKNDFYFAKTTPGTAMPIIKMHSLKRKILKKRGGKKMHHHLSYPSDKHPIKPQTIEEFEYRLCKFIEAMGYAIKGLDEKVIQTAS